MLDDDKTPSFPTPSAASPQGCGAESVNAPAHTPTAATCAPEEVAANFMALLKDADFSYELRMCNVGKFRPLLRRTLIQELNAVYTGLWALALRQSFPQTAEVIFEHFVQQYAGQFGGAAQKQTIERIFAYRDMILNNDSKDFNHISRHILSFVKVDDKTLKADILRLSLSLRNHYTFIFERLV